MHNQPHNDSEYWHLQRFNADLRRADKGPPEGLDAFSEDEPEPPKGSFDEDGNFLYDE